VAFSTRRGGVSEGPYGSLNLGILTGDDRDRVERNRDLLAEAAGLGARSIAMGLQVHGNAVREWERAPSPGGGDSLPAGDTAAAGDSGAAGDTASLPRVDGHVTDRDDLALLVLVADCLPVALSGGGRVAIVHCGWRGLAGEILANALAHFGEPPAAALGPAIGRCCYEVGDEVRERFDARFSSGRMLDLRAAAEGQLRAGGVSRVEHVDLCTSCRGDLFFSHRRDAGVTGRQGGLAWRA
jgi:YfiH family protein